MGGGLVRRNLLPFVALQQPAGAGQRPVPRLAGRLVGHPWARSGRRPQQDRAGQRRLRQRLPLRPLAVMLGYWVVGLLELGGAGKLRPPVRRELGTAGS